MHPHTYMHIPIVKMVGTPNQSPLCSFEPLFKLVHADTLLQFFTSTASNSEHNSWPAGCLFTEYLMNPKGNNVSDLWDKVTVQHVELCAEVSSTSYKTQTLTHLRALLNTCKWKNYIYSTWWSNCVRIAEKTFTVDAFLSQQHLKHCKPVEGIPVQHAHGLGFSQFCDYYV